MSTITHDNDALHNSALRLLARRNHSNRELAAKLATRGYEKNAITAECERLLKAGLLDDLEFSQHYLTVRAARGFGPARIRSELFAKGVTKEIINQAFDQCEINWREQHRKVENKKRLNQAGNTQLERVKRARFMRYRGFGELPQDD